MLGRIPRHQPPDSLPSPAAPKTLVLGLGNPILTDDGVGILVVRAVASRVPSDWDVAFDEASVGGLRLLDLIEGYDRLVLVDAIQTRADPPGTVHRLDIGDLKPSLHSGSSHDLSLSGVLDMGRRLGLNLPSDENISIVAIEVDDVLTISEACTPAVTRAIPDAMRSILAELRDQKQTSTRRIRSSPSPCVPTDK